MKVRRSSPSYHCGIHGMRSKPSLVLNMKRRSTIPKTRNFCWNSIRTSRTTRFCSPAEARRISRDNLAGALYQHSCDGSRHQVRHGSRQHGSYSETRQFPFLVWRERTDSADLNPNGTYVREPAQREGGNREGAGIEGCSLSPKQRERHLFVQHHSRAQQVADNRTIVPRDADHPCHRSEKSPKDSLQTGRKP